KVFKAWQEKLRRYVALKFLHIMDEEKVRRFQREAQLLAQLQHSNIAGVHEICDVEGQLFLVMHYIDGPSIDQVELSLEQLLPSFVKICRAVDFAHTHKIIHRDIKPGNILVGSDQEVYVTDFGLARVMKPDVSASASGNILGTPLFMPPEQARGKMNQIDAQSDIYSLGATFYNLVTGRPPFEGDDIGMILLKVISEEPTPPRKILPTIPISVEAIILKAMEKEKPNRYTSAEEMALDLEKYISGQKVSAKPVSNFRRLGRKIKKNPWPVAALSLLCIAGLLPFFFPTKESSAPTPTPTPPLVQKQSWKDRFGQLQPKLDYYGFDQSSPELIKEGRGLFAQIPEEEMEEVLGWFSHQTDRLPKKPWPKAAWIQKKSEAARISHWCGMIGKILKGLGGGFPSIHLKMTRTAEQYAAISAYRGTIDLQLIFRPYGKILELKAGENWIIKEGRKKETEVEITGDDFHTPLVMRNLDIAIYTLLVAHPTLGKQKFTIDPDNLTNGASYVYGGALHNPGSIRLRRLP
ncbi:MAG: serine/threonine-protein kinase, partial [Planctomycetota bacterium]|nr:serine/threonine-protein kinase [Planctomycetota bacterium]